MAVLWQNKRLLQIIILSIDVAAAIAFSIASGFRFGTSLAFAGILLMCTGAVLTHQSGVTSGRYNASLNPLMPEIDLKELQIEHDRVTSRRGVGGATKIDLIKLGAIPFFIGILMLILN